MENLLDFLKYCIKLLYLTPRLCRMCDFNGSGGGDVWSSVAGLSNIWVMGQIQPVEIYDPTHGLWISPVSCMQCVSWTRHCTWHMGLAWGAWCKWHPRWPGVVHCLQIDLLCFMQCQGQPIYYMQHRPWSRTGTYSMWYASWTWHYGWYVWYLGLVTTWPNRLLGPDEFDTTFL